MLHFLHSVINLYFTFGYVTYALFCTV